MMFNVVVFILLGTLLHCSSSQFPPVQPEVTCLTTGCKNGECIKNDPRYPLGYCRCNWGYKLSATDKSVCEDRDECAMADRLVCGGGLCRNTMGGYYCDCFRGYKPTFFRTYCQPLFRPPRMGQSMMNMALLKRFLD